MPDWIQDNQTLLWILGGASAAMFLGSLLALPFVVARIPADYFAHERRQRNIEASRHPVMHVAILVVKNLLGVCFIAAGLAMLVLPGQGIITIIVGLVLLDLPGKYRLERWLVSRRSVRRAIDWLRARSGTPPLRIWRPGDGAARRSADER